MADETSAPVLPPDPGESALSPQSGGFLSTTVGKIVVGAVALVVLLSIAGAIVLMLASGGIAGLLKSGTSTATSIPAPATASITSAETSPAVPAANPAELELNKTFTFRNIFAPSVKPPLVPTVDTSSTATAATTTSTTPTTTSSSSTSSSVDVVGTLVLTEIIAEGDAHKGVFTWNGETYTAGNGVTVDSSPWKVLEIGTDSALMLYGDVQVTIAVGQSITK